MMSNPQIFNAVLTAIASYHQPLKLMILATAEQDHYQHLAKQAGVSLLFEAFADRRYTDEGKLTPRSQAGAVLSEAEMLQQVQQLVQSGTVTTQSGQKLALKADTLCVHGDNSAAILQIAKIRQLLV